jgi:hypothetical protein
VTRHRTPATRLNLSSALGRYGFTALALLALANNLILPTVVCGAIAIYAWKNAR